MYMSVFVFEYNVFIHVERYTSWWPDQRRERRERERLQRTWWEQEYLSGRCLFSQVLAAQRQSTAIGHPAGWRESPKHADGTTAIAQKSGCEWSGERGWRTSYRLYRRFRATFASVSEKQQQAFSDLQHVICAGTWNLVQYKDASM